MQPINDHPVNTPPSPHPYNCKLLLAKVTAHTEFGETFEAPQMHAIYHDEVMCVSKYMMQQTTMSPVTEQ